MKTNLLKQLKKEHEELAELFKKLDKTSEKSPDKRMELFKALDFKLSPHAEAEENVLYSRLKQEMKKPSDVLEAYEEHNLAKLLLSELRLLDPRDEKWGAKCTVLSELIEHHVEQEESALFKDAKQCFDSRELESMAGEYLEEKEVIISAMESTASGNISEPDGKRAQRVKNERARVHAQ